MMRALFFMRFWQLAALPALAVAFLLFLSGKFKEPLKGRFQATVVACGLSIAFELMLGKVIFPPLSLSGALPFVALLLMVFVWIRPQAVNIRYLLRALFVGLSGGLILWSVHKTLIGPVHTRNLLAFFFLGLGVWSIAERASVGNQIVSLIALPMLTVAALGVYSAFHLEYDFTFDLTVVEALLGAILAVAIVAPNKISTIAVLPFVSVFVVALMAAAHFYFHFNPWILIYLASPYLLLWIRPWIPFLPKQAVAEALVLSAVSLMPLGYLLWTTYVTLR